jgi:uncharacterized RDD family membrane protein YckC
LADVVTGDAVVLDVQAAAFPSRMAALLIDMVVQVTLMGVTFLVIGKAAPYLSGAAVAATVTVTIALALVGYPTIFETLSRGKSLGKLALGLRVVADDGGPERFRQALVRALAGLFEIWSIILDPVALISSLVSAKGKRLGDIFAGTYVITERVPGRGSLPAWFAVVPPELTGWAARLEISGLSDAEAEAASSYLRRFGELQPAARDALGLRIAGAVAARISPPPPPGTPPAAFLAAVLTVRRDRDLARLAGATGSDSRAVPEPPDQSAGRAARQEPDSHERGQGLHTPPR